MWNKERNFSPSVFLRELSHACRKLHCLHCGINSEGLKSPTVRDSLLLVPQNRTVNQGGGPWARGGLIDNVLGYLMFTHEEMKRKKGRSMVRDGWWSIFFKNTCIDSDRSVSMLSNIKKRGDGDKKRSRNRGISKISGWQTDMIKTKGKRKSKKNCLIQLHPFQARSPRTTTCKY